MITITKRDKSTPQIRQFQIEEWKPADRAHFGREIDWTKEEFLLEASQDGNIVGIMEITVQLGVMHIDSLIVKHEKHRQGIGKILMNTSEEIAKEKNVHKIYLETGKDWEEV